ncbi:hypothetical protein ACP275_03G051000 [Erythranthe tilingii]
MAKFFLLCVLIIIFYLSVVCGRDLPISGKICKLGDVIVCNTRDATSCDTYCINSVPKKLRIAQAACEYDSEADANYCYCYYQCSPP